MITIRRMVESDVIALVPIVSANYGRLTAEHFHSEMVCAFMPYPFRLIMYTVEDTGEIVGCGGYNCSWLGFGTYSLSWVNIAPHMQGRGLGKLLISKLLEELKPMATYVILATSVPNFYEKLDFKIIDHYTPFDVDGGVVMSRSLAEQ